MDRGSIRAALARIYTKETVAENVPMERYTSFRAGGPAAFLVEPDGSGALAATIEACRAAAAPYCIIGNGSNILVADAGYDGVIIRIGEAFGALSADGEILSAGAGAPLSAAARYAAEQGLAGLEFASGIPGSVGGGVVMNAGAYGGELKDVLLDAECLDGSGQLRTFGVDALQLSYRHSRCQQEALIVTSARFRLRRDDRDAILSRMRQLTRQRNDKQPVQWPSAGSVFKRPPGHYAGRLIEEAGLKGLALGGARISPMHAGFIINENSATADDILKLIDLVKLIVFDHSGVWLEEEVKILGRGATARCD